jgi:hypothetical protein
VGEEYFGVDEPAALSIGVLVGGWSPYTSEWKAALQNLSQRVTSVRDGASSPLNVNVIFQVPGNNITPDFEGIRTGYFSKKKMWLIVQVALPEAPPEGGIDADLLNRLKEAIDEAETWAKRRKIAGDLLVLHRIVDKL